MKEHDDREFGAAQARSVYRIQRGRSGRTARTPEARRRELAAVGASQNHGLTLNYPAGSSNYTFKAAAVSGLLRMLKEAGL